VQTVEMMKEKGHNFNLSLHLSRWLFVLIKKKTCIYKLMSHFGIFHVKLKKPTQSKLAKLFKMIKAKS
jgi:hypothetical protein